MIVGFVFGLVVVLFCLVVGFFVVCLFSAEPMKFQLI